MPNVRILATATGVLLVIASATAVRAQDVSPEQTLKGRNLKKSGTTWILPGETSILKDVRDAKAIYQQVAEGQMQQRELEYGLQGRKAGLQELRGMNDMLGQQIAQIDQQLEGLVVPPGGNVFVQQQRDQLSRQRQTLVLQNNQVINQLNTFQEQQRDPDHDPKLQLNAEVAERREKYMQAVLDLRKAADEIKAKYAELAKDPEITKALADLSAATKLKQRLGPSKSLQDALKLIDRAEGSVQSDTIKLTREGGVFHVQTMLNGKVPARMVFDTGAGITTISAKLATRIGLKYTPEDAPLRLKTADGTEVEAKRARIPSVRVGKFVIPNVECAVMPDSKGDVDSLLGQSFFKFFKVEFSAEAGTLALKKLETPESEKEALAAEDTSSKPEPKSAGKSKRTTRQPRATVKSKRTTRGRLARGTQGNDLPPDGEAPAEGSDGEGPQ